MTVTCVMVTCVMVTCDGDGGGRSGCDGKSGAAGVMVMGDGGRSESDGGSGVAGVMVGYRAHVLCG